MNGKNKHKHPLGLTAYQWKFFVSQIWQEAIDLSTEQYIEIKYSTLIESTYKVLKSVLTFCNLRFSERMRDYINTLNLKNMNYKWKHQLNSQEQMELNEILYEDKYKQTFDF